MVKIIGFPFSTSALRPLVVLEELGIEYELVIPKDLQKAALVDQFLSVETTTFDRPSSTILFEEIFTKYAGNETNVENVKGAKEKLGKVLDDYEKLLEGKDYLAGEYSLADIA